jgi:hypothetical protein
MKSSRVLLPLLLAATTSGCVVPVVEPVYSTCRGMSGGDWKATIERVPRYRGDGPNKRILVVSGKVTLREGIEPGLDLGPVEKYGEITQQILVRTDGQAAADAPLVTREVRGRFVPLKRFGAVRIRCGDGIFAVIESIEEAAAPPS